MTKLRQKDRELDTIKNKLKFILNLHGTHYFLPKDENVVVDNLLSYGTADKFLTMSTEFDKNSSKWSYYSTDHKDHIKHFPSKLLDPQKSTFGDVILGIKLF